jgi:phage antirepressor YoqD-like protein
MAQQPSAHKTETKPAKPESKSATSGGEPKPTKADPIAETSKPFTVNDIAKDAGVKPAVARRFLRAAQIKRPKDGWSWTDKSAAKDAIEAVQRGLKAKTAATGATPPPKPPTGTLGRA